MIVEEGYQSGCMIKELDANECRFGCPICHLNAKAKHIKKIFPNAKEGPGKSFLDKTTKTDASYNVRSVYKPADESTHGSS